VQQVSTRRRQITFVYHAPYASASSEVMACEDVAHALPSWRAFNSTGIHWLTTTRTVRKRTSSSSLGRVALLWTIATRLLHPCKHAMKNERETRQALKEKLLISRRPHTQKSKGRKQRKRKTTIHLVGNSNSCDTAFRGLRFRSGSC